MLSRDQAAISQWIMGHEFGQEGNFTMDEEHTALVLLLLEEGSKEQAIRLYQEETGLHYLDAKRQVNELAAHHGLRSRGIVAWALALVAAVSLFGFLLSH
jgi:hypothetical protein